MKTAKSILLTSLKYILFLISVLIIILGASGAYIPKDLDKYKKIGYFQIKPYKYGVYLTQKDSGIFYNFSPFNDYKLGSSPKITLLDYDVSPTSKESVKKTDFIGRYGILLDAVKSYMGFYSPMSTFIFGDTNIIYQTTFYNNRMFIEYSKNIDTRIVRTMSINASDLIYDSDGNVYSVTDPETVSLFNNVYKKTLNPNIKTWDETRFPQYIYIFNPETNGQITLTRDTESFKVSNIDIINMRIEFQIKNNEQNRIYLDLSEQI